MASDGDEYLGYDRSQVPSQAVPPDPAVYDDVYNSIPDRFLLDSQYDSQYDGAEDRACAASPLPINPTPTLSPTQKMYSTPCAYPLSYTPSQRDYDGDYEAVMIAVNDLNRLTKFIMFRGGIPPQQPDPTGIPTTREDVLEALDILRQMMTRMYTRLELS